MILVLYMRYMICCQCHVRCVSFLIYNRVEMGLLTIIRKNKMKEREMRILFL